MSHSELQHHNPQWTLAHDRAFERALVIFPENIPNRWEKMKHYVPGNWSPEHLKERYRKLEHDVFLIQSGQFEFPKWWNKVDAAAVAEVHSGTPALPVPIKKGTAWTEEEHILFLLGLEKCGKGDWKRIARQFVVSRTSTQVASHAQKYFLRQNASKKERKRESIHDITTRESDQNLLPLPRLSNQHNSAPHPDNQTPPAQNWVPPSDVDAQQLQELQRALQQAPAEMGIFGQFNSNCF